MSRLHSRFIPWIMLAAFMVAAVTFFSLAAGRESVRLPGVFSLGGLLAERPAPGEVRRAVSRAREAEQNAERWLMGKAGRALEAEAQRLDERGKRLEAKAGQDQASEQVEEQLVEAPTRLLSHRYNEAAAEFTATFTTDLPPGEGRTYFLRNPARYVVDMKGHWQNASPRLSTLNGHFISRVVIDAHDSFLRVVFHCTDQATEIKEHLKLEKGPAGFTVTIPRPQ